MKIRVNIEFNNVMEKLKNIKEIGMIKIVIEIITKMIIKMIMRVNKSEV